MPSQVVLVMGDCRSEVRGGCPCSPGDHGQDDGLASALSRKLLSTWPWLQAEAVSVGVTHGQTRPGCLVLHPFAHPLQGDLEPFSPAGQLHSVSSSRKAFSGNASTCILALKVLTDSFLSSLPPFLPSHPTPSPNFSTELYDRNISHLRFVNSQWSWASYSHINVLFKNNFECFVTR